MSWVTKVIQEEEAEELRVKLKALNLSEDVHTRIDKEISRYSRMPQLMPEANNFAQLPRLGIGVTVE